VITGTIKANIPARLAFAVASATDSKVILDGPGAERLVGKGDMLLLGSGSSVPHRIQGAWVDEKEVANIAAFWRRQGAAADSSAVDEVQGDQNAPAGGGASGGGGGGGAGDDDTLLEQAMDLVVTEQLGSTSMLQRRLKVGFARAGRLMDLLEQRGVVGPSEGSKARAVLITPQELAAMRGGGPAPDGDLGADDAGASGEPDDDPF
jgi:S-DNA-T family DNA segregation ATPase FtsK/SpoIIIE